MSKLTDSADTTITKISSPGWPVVAIIKGPTSDIMPRYNAFLCEVDGNFSVKLLSNDGVWMEIETRCEFRPHMRMIPAGMYGPVRVRDDGSPIYYQ